MIISFFAAVVTIAIFIWELRNISLYKWYIDYAKILEYDLFNQYKRQFSGRPKPTARIIRKTTAEWIIYVATIFAWIAFGITSLIA
jgi:hypothetical protein